MDGRVRKYILFVFIIVFGGLLALFALENGRDDLGKDYPFDENNHLIIYTSHKENIYEPIISEFEERTGIWVEVIAGGTNELLEELKNGEGKGADVFFGGGVDSLQAYGDCFQSYEPKDTEMLQSTYYSDDHCWTAFSGLPIVIIYNNKLVYSSNVPMSWEELFLEKWKGKIAFADPRKSGTSYTALSTMLQLFEEDDRSIMRRFVYNLDGHISESSGAVLDDVISGKRLVGITLEETAKKRLAQGADIGIVYPKEGVTAVPDGCAILKDAGNLENAKLFMDFIVSQDVQKYIVEECYRRSVRTDIEKMPLENEISYDLVWASENQGEVLSVFAEVLEGGSHEE